MTINLARIRRVKVVAVQCGYCRQWVKPRYLRVPSMCCRDCEATAVNQTWKASPERIRRAHADAAKTAAARNHGTPRHAVTLAGR